MAIPALFGCGCRAEKAALYCRESAACILRESVVYYL